MKFLFGHPAADESKVSKALEEKGIKALRAAPGEIPAVGLYNVEQDGYSFYAAHLPAYMRATSDGAARLILGCGHAIKTKLDDLIKVNFPKVFMVLKKGTKIDQVTKSEWELIAERKDKISYAVKFSKTMLANPEPKGTFPNEYAPGQYCRYGDVVAMVTIARIFSGFLRTHKFPAFASYNYVETEHLSSKRGIEAVDIDESKDKLAEGTYATKQKSYGRRSKHSEYPSSGKPQYIFHQAKPNKSTNLPWGRSDQLPQTNGIHMPFEMLLSRPDKETVPRVLERFFLTAFHDDLDTCLKLFSEVVQQWKGSLFTTEWGHQMSHLARVIELAIPAQARVFPIVGDGMYYGSFLSGALFSIGTKGKLVKPESYKISCSELSCYREQTADLDEIMNILESAFSVDDSVAELVRIAGKKNLRALSIEIVSNFSLDATVSAKLRKVFSRMRFQTPYLVPNAANIKWLIEGFMKQDLPSIEYPTTADVAFSEDPFISYLSAFGPNVPIPNMPGTPKIKITDKMPEKFNKQIGIRLADVDTAAQEWKEIGKSRTIQNGFENLSAKYEHSLLSGHDNKVMFFDCMKRYGEWYLSLEKEVVKGHVDPVEGEKTTLLDAVIGNFDFSDF